MYPKFIFVIYLAKSVFVFKIVYANLLPKLSALSSDQIDKYDVDFGAVRIRKNVQWFTRWRQIRRLIVVDNTQSSSKFPFTSLYICYGWIHRLIPQNTRQWPELDKKAVFGRTKNLRSEMLIKLTLRTKISLRIFLSYPLTFTAHCFHSWTYLNYN